MNIQKRKNEIMAATPAIMRRPVELILDLIFELSAQKPEETHGSNEEARPKTGGEEKPRRRKEKPAQEDAAREP